jgi:hypothetical protein
MKTRTATAKLNSAQELARLRRVAKLMDSAFRIPGTRYTVGWDAIVGLLPGVGDAVMALGGAYIVYRGWQMGLPRTTRMRLLANWAIDLGGGSIPVLGEIFDAAWKSNVRNVELIEAHLREQAPEVHAEPVPDQVSGRLLGIIPGRQRHA